MSSLNPKPDYIKINGIEYGIYFPLRAVDTIQDKFDISINQIVQKFNDLRTRNKFLAFVLETLIFEANDLAKEQTGIEQVNIKADYIHKRILPLEAKAAITAVYKAYSSGGVESDDNGESDPNVQSE